MAAVVCRWIEEQLLDVDMTAKAEPSVKWEGLVYLGPKQQALCQLYAHFISYFSLSNPYGGLNFPTYLRLVWIPCCLSLNMLVQRPVSPVTSHCCKTEKSGCRLQIVILWRCMWMKCSRSVIELLLTLTLNVPTVTTLWLQAWIMFK